MCPRPSSSLKNLQFPSSTSPTFPSVCSFNSWKSEGQSSHSLASTHPLLTAHNCTQKIAAETQHPPSSVRARRPCVRAFTRVRGSSERIKKGKIIFQSDAFDPARAVAALVRQEEIMTETITTVLVMHTKCLISG